MKKNLYQQFFELNPELLCILNQTGEFIKANQACLSILGIELKHLVDKKLQDFISVFDKKLFSAAIEQSKIYGSRISVQARCYQYDGEWLWFHWDFCYDKELEFIYCIGKDINHLRQDIDRLDQSRINIQRILNSLPLGVFVTNPEGTVQFVNDNARDLIKLEVESSLSSSIFKDQYSEEQISEEEFPPFLALTQKELHAKNLFLRKNDRNIPVFITSIPIFTFSKTLKYVISIIDKQEQQFKKKNEIMLAQKEAERANQDKSNFFSTISYKLRTPLNSILGYGEMLIDQDELNDLAISDLEKILNSCKKLMILINEVIDMAQVNSDFVEDYFNPLNIYQLIDEVLLQVKPLLDKNGVKIELQMPHNIDLMYSNEFKLKQQLFNFVWNTCKFIENTNITLHVSLLDKDNQQNLRFEFTTPEKALSTDIGVL